MLFIQDRLYAEQSFSFIFGVFIYETDLKNKWRTLSNSTQIAIVICGLAVGSLSLIIKQTGMVSEENYLLYNVEQLLIKLPVAVSLLLGTSILIRHKTGWGILKGYKLLAPLTIEIYLIHVYVLFLFERYELSNGAYLLCFSMACIAGVALLKVIERITNEIGRKLIK